MPEEYGPVAGDQCAPPLIPDFRPNPQGGYDLYCIQPRRGRIAFRLEGITPFLSIAALGISLIALART